MQDANNEIIRTIFFATGGLVLLCAGFIVSTVAFARKRLRMQRRQIAELQSKQHKIEEQASLLNIASDAIFVMDFAQRVRFWNASAERLYRVPLEDVSLHSAAELLYGRENAAVVASAVDRVQRAGQWRGEIAIHTERTPDLTVDSRWTLVRDNDGSPKGIFVVDTDISEKKRLEERLGTAKKLEGFGILAGGMAHDLKNIFRPMQMMLESIKSKGLDQSQLNRLGVLEEGVGLGLDLVAKVLGFAKGTSAAKTRVAVPVLLNRLHAFLDETQSAATRVHISSTEDLEPILADESQAYQVLYNLCINARDAMPDGGDLTVVAENFTVGKEGTPAGGSLSPGRYVRIQVRDTGTGIPAEILRRIWEPLYSTKGSRGSGLGLATVMSIIHNHHGEVTVETRVGAGSTFTVYFPVLTGPVLSWSAQSLESANDRSTQSVTR